MLNFPICLAASFCLTFRMGEGDNDAKVLLYFEIRGMDTDFSLGKGCERVTAERKTPDLYWVGRM